MKCQVSFIFVKGPWNKGKKRTSTKTMFWNLYKKFIRYLSPETKIEYLSSPHFLNSLLKDLLTVSSFYQVVDCLTYKIHTHYNYARSDLCKKSIESFMLFTSSSGLVPVTGQSLSVHVKRNPIKRKEKSITTTKEPVNIVLTCDHSSLHNFPIFFIDPLSQILIQYTWMSLFK